MTALQKSAIAAGAMLLVMLAAGLSSGRLQRLLHPTQPPPGSWNSQAIQATFAGVEVRENDASNASVLFFYDVTNKTTTDLQLMKGSNLVIMGRLRADDSLSAEEPAALATNVFVPANNKTRIALEIAHPFGWPSDTDTAAGEKYRGLVQNITNKLSGFVIFDQNTRYEIELPGAWTDIGPVPAIPGRN